MLGVDVDDTEFSSGSFDEGKSFFINLLKSLIVGSGGHKV